MFKLNPFERVERVYLFPLAGEGSFTATKLSSHAITNMELIQLFLSVRFEIDRREGHIEVRVRRDSAAG